MGELSLMVIERDLTVEGGNLINRWRSASENSFKARGKELENRFGHVTKRFLVSAHESQRYDFELLSLKSV